MELLILAAHLGRDDKPLLALAKIPQIREAHECGGLIVAKARVEGPADVRRIADVVRRCPGILRVEILVRR